MQLAKKTVLTNSAMTTLGTSQRILEDAIIDLHKNDNDNWAIGDIKNTTRAINDPNWHKCDGSYMMANVPNDIKNTLVRKHQVKLTTAVMQDTNPASNWNYYSDANYVIVASSYSITNAGGWVKLFIYTRDATTGLLVANSQKTLRSWGDKYSMAWPGPIIKCGNYYYVVVRYDDDDSEGLEQRYWHLYYTTNPTGTWSARQVWSGGNQMAYLWGLYTNGSTARLELCSSNSGSSGVARTVTVYTFSGDTSNITSSTYNCQVNTHSGMSGMYDYNNTYPLGDGKYVKCYMGLSGQIVYKSSFTSGWSSLALPSWAYSWLTAAYVNGKYYGIFKKSNAGNDYTYYFVIANSLTAFASSTLANLTYYTFTNKSSNWRFWGRTNAGIWGLIQESEVVDSITVHYTYLAVFTEDGIKKHLINNVSWGTNEAGKANDGTYTAVLHCTLSDYKNNFYFISLAYPDMSDQPYDAYMKIATN